MGTAKAPPQLLVNDKSDKDSWLCIDVSSVNGDPKFLDRDDAVSIGPIGGFIRAFKN